MSKTDCGCATHSCGCGQTCGHECDSGCGHRHETPQKGLSREQKIMLVRMGITVAMLAGLHFVPADGIARFFLYLVPYLFMGYDILLEAAEGIRHRRVFDVNFLMTVATLGALAIGLTSTGDYTEAVGVMLFYQAGEWFEGFAVGKSRRNISQLMDIRPDYANILEGGRLKRVAPDSLPVGSRIVVQSGEKIPLDGVIESGSSALNTVALTGESLPRDVGPGDSVTGGCVNLSGSLTIRTTKEFGQSTVAKIMELVEHAGERKARSEAFIIKFARIYTPIVCFAALALFLLPPLVQLLLKTEAQWGTWLYRSLTFLVISCPCALVISVPLTFFAGIGGASRAGILIKGSNFMETLAKTRCMVFDKTGTLTLGSFTVAAIVPNPRRPARQPVDGSPQSSPDDETSRIPAADGIVHLSSLTQNQLLEYAALAECSSSHPVSRSILAAYGKEPDRSLVTDAQEIAGQGLVAVVEGRRVAVGNVRLMVREGIDVAAENLSSAVGLAEESAELDAEATTNSLVSAKLHAEAVPNSLESAGTRIHVAIDGNYAGHLVLADTIKPAAPAALSQLKALGIRETVMLSGDSKTVAQAVGRQLGIDRVESQLLPNDKVAKVEELLSRQKDGEKLAFVGDGINDAPVLSRSDVGIAMGGLGADAAIEAADVVLMDDNPLKIPAAIRISRRTLGIAAQNIVFALGVKSACMVLGALGLTTMWLAIFADVGVMILAVLNAIRALSVGRSSNN